MKIEELFSVQGKVALVTGGSRGIGEMIAAGFLTNGVKVYISSRKKDQCDATAARLSETYGAECISIPANLSELSGIESLVAALSEREDHLDILVNNAGVAWGAPLEEFPEVGWDKVFDTNVKGVFFLTQKLLPLLEANATKEDPARIINIGSIDGIRTPMFDTHSYGPSKAALHTLTTQMAAKLVKRNIIANAIACAFQVVIFLQRFWQRLSGRMNRVKRNLQEERMILLHLRGHEITSAPREAE